MMPLWILELESVLEDKKRQSLGKNENPPVVKFIFMWPSHKCGRMKAGRQGYFLT